MLLVKLALRNLIGAGLRTWLNVIVLSLSFVMIIWMQGLYLGIYDQAKHNMIKKEIGSGQYWVDGYDPFDPLTLLDSHAKIPAALQKRIDAKQATAVLITQAAIYPNGRLQSVLMKGIDPNQTMLDFPTSVLNNTEVDLPILIGNQTAETTKLKEGDLLTIRWRDANGAFDARDGIIVKIMKPNAPNIDKGQIWIPLKHMQAMTGMTNEASNIVMKAGLLEFESVDGWQFKNLAYFLRDVEQFVEMKTGGASIMYIIMMMLAMLGIFDTQVLSIFKRRKEIGTLMALGVTRLRVIGLFTLEGAFNGVLAGILATIYGGPLIYLTAVKGIPVPEMSQNALSFGIPDYMFPSYGMGLILGTTAIIMVTTTFISFLPTRKIATLKPTDAIRGKMS